MVHFHVNILSVKAAFESLYPFQLFRVIVKGFFSLSSLMRFLWRIGLVYYACAVFLRFVVDIIIFVYFSLFPFILFGTRLLNGWCT